MFQILLAVSALILLFEHANSLTKMNENNHSEHRNNYVTNNYYAPSTHIDNHAGGVVNIGNSSSSEISKFHFPAAFPTNEGEKLYNFLQENKFVPEGADLDDFMYVMGCIPQRPRAFHPLQWLTTKQQLRTLLEHAYAPLFTAGMMTKKNMEEVVPNCFIGIDGNPYSLSKPREEFSAEIDKIVDFFRPEESEI